VLGLNYDGIENYLKSYGKYIVRQARGILKQRGKDDTGKLSKSLKFKITQDKEGYEIKFLASKYAAFVNKGVSGTKGRRTYIDADGKRKQSPFKFKKQPPSSVIEGWVKRKGIKGRDKKGRFITRKSLSFLIARSIKKKGIPAASFYTQPLSYSYKLFKKEMVKHFKADVLNEIKTFKK
jgi:hypothetical protein|tara:strand:+ start:466 stop:1002 length:537 start_codon:yes stop_codon:yes gene_type:complete